MIRYLIASLLISFSINAETINTGNILTNSTFGTGNTTTTTGWSTSGDDGIHTHGEWGFPYQTGMDDSGGVLAFEGHTEDNVYQDVDLVDDGHLTQSEMNQGFTSTMSADVWFWNSIENTFTLKQTITGSDGSVSTQIRDINDHDPNRSMNGGQFTNYTNVHIQGSNTQTDITIRAELYNETAGTTYDGSHRGPDVDNVTLNVAYRDIPPISEDAQEAIDDIDNTIDDVVDDIDWEEDYTWNDDWYEDEYSWEENFYFEEEYAWEDDFYFEDNYTWSDELYIDDEITFEMEEWDLEEIPFDEIPVEEVFFEETFAETPMDIVEEVFEEEFEEEFTEFLEESGMQEEFEQFLEDEGMTQEEFFEEIAEEEFNDEFTEESFEEFEEPMDEVATTEESSPEIIEDEEETVEETVAEPEELEEETEIASNSESNTVQEEDESSEVTEETNTDEEESDSEGAEDEEVQTEEEAEQDTVQSEESGVAEGRTTENVRISDKKLKTDLKKVAKELAKIAKETTQNLTKEEIFFKSNNTLDAYLQTDFYKSKDIYTNTDMDFFNQADLSVYTEDIYTSVTLAQYTENDPVEVHNNKMKEISIKKRELMIELQQLRSGKL